MFAKLATLALAVRLASAFTINALQGATSSGQVTITWSASTTDPQTFSIELVNTAFNNEYAIANNIATAQGSLTITLPEVPATDGYSLEAISISNVNQVYATSGSFSIGATSSSSTTAASTTSSASSSSGTLSTPSSTSTTPVSSVSASNSAASSASSAASASPSTLNSGAAPLKVPAMVPAAGLLLSAVAGAAMVF